ncbi:MAG TPA: cupredoxin domain-containing protein [Gaiellaceae bacterium]|nr:cupredoxin domain-containing protein [Gaiellaceae bacterium]
MRPALLLSFAAAAVLLTACGGGDGGGEPVATTEVTMPKSYRFEPETIEVEAGATVTWTNEDNFTHTVQVDGREDHEVEPGESVSLEFDEPGTYHYVCRLHRTDMEGDVIVR